MSVCGGHILKSLFELFEDGVCWRDELLSWEFSSWASTWVEYIQVMLKVVLHRVREHTLGSPASLLQAALQELLIIVGLGRTTGHALRVILYLLQAAAQKVVGNFIALQSE